MKKLRKNIIKEIHAKGRITIAKAVDLAAGHISTKQIADTLSKLVSDGVIERTPSGYVLADRKGANDLL